MARQRSFSPPGDRTAWMEMQLNGLRFQLAQAKRVNQDAIRVIEAYLETLLIWLEQEPSLETLVHEAINLNQELIALRAKGK